ncbi:hypothetical protein [Kribbella speibonae]|nr:hypothetical protein [Kribbella speibonae]
MPTPKHGAAGPAFDRRGDRRRTAQTRVVRYQQPVARRLTTRRGNR